MGAVHLWFFFGLKYEAIVEGWWYFSAMLLIHTFLPKTVSHNIWAENSEAWQSPGEVISNSKSRRPRVCAGEITACGVCPGTSGCSHGRSHRSVARLVRVIQQISSLSDDKASKTCSRAVEEAVDSQESLEKVKENTGTAEPMEGFVYVRTLCGEGVPERSKAGKPPKTGRWSRARCCLQRVIRRGGRDKPGKSVVSSCPRMLHKTHGPSSSKLMLFIAGSLNSWKGRWKQDRKVEKTFSSLLVAGYSPSNDIGKWKILQFMLA